MNMNLAKLEIVNDNSKSNNSKNDINTININRFRDYIINDFFSFLDVSEKTVAT